MKRLPTLRQAQGKPPDNLGQIAQAVNAHAGYRRTGIRVPRNYGKMSGTILLLRGLVVK